MGMGYSVSILQIYDVTMGKQSVVYTDLVKEAKLVVH